MGLPSRRPALLALGPLHLCIFADLQPQQERPGHSVVMQDTLKIPCDSWADVLEGTVFQTQKPDSS